MIVDKESFVYIGCEVIESAELISSWEGTIHLLVLFVPSSYIILACIQPFPFVGGFYHDYQILKEPNEQKRAVRLALCEAVAKVIKSGMGLLGIEVPERM